MEMECTHGEKIMSKTKTTEEFIQEAQRIHGKIYDYSKVVYKSAFKKVEIICPIHGSFFQEPHGHLSGKRCFFCYGRRKESTAIFIKKANAIHNNKYDYSKTKYINSREKVEITCPKHGSFKQIPAVHLQGCGCRKCFNEQNLNKNGSKQENFLHELLINKFGDCILRNYKSTIYPFYCDFYIPERKLFIEYNGYYMHGNEWCDLRTSISQKRVENWTSKNTPQYKKAIQTYCKDDVFKRKTAKKNNLNYVVLWNEQDIEDWFALGCPDGHDWKKEYSWK